MFRITLRPFQALALFLTRNRSDAVHDSQTITKPHICSGTNQNKLEDSYLSPSHANSQVESITPSTAEILALDHKILRDSVAKLINLHSKHLSWNYMQKDKVLTILLIPRSSTAPVSEDDLIQSGENISEAIFHSGERVNITSIGILEQATNLLFKDAVIDHEQQPHIVETEGKSIIHAGQELEKSESAIAIVIFGTNQLKIGLINKVKSSNVLTDSIKSASRAAAAL